MIQTSVFLVCGLKHNFSSHPSCCNLFFVLFSKVSADYVTNLATVCEIRHVTLSTLLQNLGSDDLNSGALKFLPKPIRNRRPASERQVETHVIYTASR